MPPPRTDEIKFDSLRFKVAKLGDGRFYFEYREGGKRCVIKRKTFEQLKAKAEEIGRKILNAETETETLTAQDRRIHVAARAALADFDLELDAAARIFRDAAKIVGSPDRILEACRHFMQQQAGSKASDITTADVVALYLRNLKADGPSETYLTKLEADLGKFTAQFPGALSAITAAELSDWIYGMPVGQRRRRKIRDQLVALSNWARDQEYLPLDRRTAAERVKRPKVQRKAPAIYTPEELDRLIVQCAQPAEKKTGRRDYMEFLPCLCIGAFAGLRWEEIQNLEWSDIHWDEGVIEVGDENKTGHRQAPIQPNLMTWLAPYKGNRHGKVCKQKRPDLAIRRLRARAGLPPESRRYANALRHSWATYRVAVTKNFPLVSHEGGHSVAELKKSYNRASFERIGKAWFSIENNAENILQMPLFSLQA